jgi:hypothetical protein
VRAAQSAGQVRRDLSPAALTSWIVLLVDGFVGRIAADEQFTAASQRATLIDTVQRLLAPR